jgi:hypothetical protein
LHPQSRDPLKLLKKSVMFFLTNHNHLVMVCV